MKAVSAIQYCFCVECLIEGRGIDRGKLRRVLQGAGDSLIVIGSEKKVRLHIHTNEPQEVFELAAGFGSLVKTKEDDMRRQHKEIIHGNIRKKIALVTDSTCDLPAELIEKYHIQIVPVMLHAGRTSYRDREDINLPEFYNLLQTTDQRKLCSKSINTLKGTKAWRHSGFSINNEIRINGSDEKARENLSQYIARPPISLKKIFYEPFNLI